MGEKVTMPGSGPAARTAQAASQSDVRFSSDVRRSISERVRSRAPEATAEMRSSRSSLEVDVEASPRWEAPGRAEKTRPR